MAVEAALVTPLIVVILLGIVEMSLLMKDTVAVSSSVRTGARIAATLAAGGPGVCQAGSNPPPCTPANAAALAQAAADTMQREGTALDRDDIIRVVVYQANSDGYPVGSTKNFATCATNCVTYVWDPNVAGGRFRYASGSWISKNINACVNDPARQSVGVMMETRHEWVSGLFGDSVTLEEHTVVQFEPLPIETCKPGAHA